MKKIIRNIVLLSSIVVILILVPNTSILVMTNFEP